MAAETATSRLTRLLTMVPWLVNRQGIELEEAARGLDVSVEQLESDLNLLFLCGYGQLPDELIEADWEEGRVFVGRGPDASAIEAFTGEPAQDPIRVYAGAESAEEAEDRAALAVLHRDWPHGSPDAPVMLPVLSTAGGTFAGRYGREAMVESALDPAQLAERPG